MPLVIKCSQCQKLLQVPDDAAGKGVRCPGCKKVFLISGAPEREAVAAATAGPPASVPPAGPSVAHAETASARATRAAGGAAPAADCPACKSPLLPGAIACMDCGYLVQGGPDAAQEATPVLCTNPACGVANSPSDRLCQRCSSPLPTPAGTVIHGRYRIERQLAVGGFGAVYLATDTRHDNRPVAVKDMICADPQEFSIRLNFFRREAEILRSLAAVPIVPRVHDFIEAGQLAYLVLEYIRGQDLLKIMEARKNQPFPIPQVIEWGKGICDVLIDMHGQSPPVIHRDLKPDNIMLMDDQKTIKMIDFGTARDLGRTQKSRLQAKTRVYTEGYAPPEQIIGKPEPRSDLFALAGTLYHLATGRPPEGYYTAQELGERLADSKCTIPVEQRWFFELLKINLAEDVNERYFSVREFKADLEHRRVTREVKCPKCQAPNQVREPYCAKCGEGLTDLGLACSQCGKSSRMGSRCCIYCGNRLR